MQSLLTVSGTSDQDLLNISLIAINDTLTDEIQVFREHANVFSEHMFLQIHFEPMREDQLK